MQSYTLIISALLAGFVGCGWQNSSNHCPENPHDNCMIEPGTCDVDADCDTGICSDAGRCVQCTAERADVCTGETPVCVNEACSPCTEHAQCSASSGVCSPSGACAPVEKIAYVSDGGTDNAVCTKAMPCTRVAKALDTMREFVMLSGTIDESVTVDNGQDVVFLAAPGAKLTSSSGGAIVTVKDDGTSLTVFDLTIRDAPNPGGIGVVIPAGAGAPTLALHRVVISNNPGGGVSASGGGSLTISQSTISGNQGGGVSASGGGSLTISRSTISGNQGGGIEVDGASAIFNITNSFVIYNGVATGPAATQRGGVVVSSNSAASKFERNTVAFNSNDGSLFRAGVMCTGTMVSATGNIVYRNSEGTATSDATQRGGNCQFGNTLALGMTAGNLGFKAPTMDPFDFHLTSTSPATVVDAAGSCSGVDVDGESRPSGGACELGADELPK